MTIHDDNVVMTPVRIRDLKARLSVEVRRATRRAKDLKRPPRLSRATDSLSVLLADRDRR